MAYPIRKIEVDDGATSIVRVHDSPGLLGRVVTRTVTYHPMVTRTRSVKLPNFRMVGLEVCSPTMQNLRRTMAPKPSFESRPAAVPPIPPRYASSSMSRLAYPVTLGAAGRGASGPPRSGRCLALAQFVGSRPRSDGATVARRCGPPGFARLTAGHSASGPPQPWRRTAASTVVASVSVGALPQCCGAVPGRNGVGTSRSPFRGDTAGS